MKKHLLIVLFIVIYSSVFAQYNQGNPVTWGTVRVLNVTYIGNTIPEYYPENASGYITDQNKIVFVTSDFHQCLSAPITVGLYPENFSPGNFSLTNFVMFNAFYDEPTGEYEENWYEEWSSNIPANFDGSIYIDMSVWNNDGSGMFIEYAIDF